MAESKREPDIWEQVEDVLASPLASPRERLLAQAIATLRERVLRLERDAVLREGA